VRQVALYRDDSERWGLAHGDALRLLTWLPARSVDAVLTDPPYALGFRGETWDQPGDSQLVSPAQAFQAWTQEWASAAWRVLKPGGYLAAFGAPRTSHRLIAGVEDAGFEIRDLLVWLFGSGVPKSRRLPGGAGTALKPAYEPILLARKPPDGTFVGTRERWGTGALEIEAASVIGPGEPSRWPPNVVLSHASSCTARRCTTDCPAALLDRARPDVRPSRFLYCAKTSTVEREVGCERLPARSHEIFSKGRRPERRRHNIHPTVKPIELMSWLVRLACPEGGVVLDPFAGSGSTGIAAVREGRGFFGIEREHDYIEIATARLAYWSHRELPSASVDGRPVGGRSPLFLPTDQAIHRPKEVMS